MTENKNKAPITPVIKEAATKPEEQLKLNEGWLSWAGKLFFAGVAAYLAGVGLEKLTGKSSNPPKLPFKLRGTPEQIKAVVDMLTASKKFQEELAKPGATVEKIINKLNLRNLTKEKFQALTGKNWPI